MIEINERKEILSKLYSKPIIPTQEQIKRDREFCENLRRESNYKSLMSEINAKENYISSSN